jgi:MoxR-like ATPase
MDFAHASRLILDNIATVIDGKPEAAHTALVVFLAEGHLLIEDVPGVGKTALATALARSVGCSVNRIQFTPDLLPSDITGVSVFNQARSEFEFKPGAVFANIVVGDEINRASAKTQSALLEAMEERTVTADGQTYQLARPFTVIATQNPHDMEGTFALPEAQRDRFMARIFMGYPSLEAELAMVRDRDDRNPLDDLKAVVTADDVRSMIAIARSVHVSESVERYVVAITRATRQANGVALGASPRATLQLIRAAKARAAIDDRAYVLPDDVDALATAVLAHRLVLAPGVARGDAAAAATIVEQIVRSTALS